MTTDWTCGTDNELNAMYMCIPSRAMYDSCLFVGWQPPTTVTSEYPPPITLWAPFKAKTPCGVCWAKRFHWFAELFCWTWNAFHLNVGGTRFENQLLSAFVNFHIHSRRIWDNILNLLKVICSPVLSSYPYVITVSSNTTLRSLYSSQSAAH